MSIGIFSVSAVIRQVFVIPVCYISVLFMSCYPLFLEFISDHISASLSGSIKSAWGFPSQQNGLLCTVSDLIQDRDSQSDQESETTWLARRSYAGSCNCKISELTGRLKRYQQLATNTHIKSNTIPKLIVLVQAGRRNYIKKSYVCPHQSSRRQCLPPKDRFHCWTELTAGWCLYWIFEAADECCNGCFKVGGHLSASLSESGKLKSPPLRFRFSFRLYMSIVR